MIRRLDVNDRLSLTDIAAENFDPSNLGKSLDTLMREIHGRQADGSWIVGVEVFREIYARVGFAGLTSISRWPVVRSLLNVGYTCFAWPRYQLALRRMRKAKSSSCDVTSANSDCKQVSSVSESSSAVTVD